MAEIKPTRRRRAASATTHQVPYPERIHAHLERATDAAAALALPAAPVGEVPTPAVLVESYGSSYGVNTSESEGGSSE